MVKVDLITGFLGAGKTTFIRKYADYLIRQGQKISIIENEFGNVSVDSLFLKDEACDISQLSGGCMCCTAKIAFENMLLDMAASGYDRILVEPSGIYDVDEFFDILLREPVKSCCEIGSILTVAEAHFADTLSYEAQYIMFSQLLNAGKVIFSKTQFTDTDTCVRTLNRFNQLILEHGSSRVFGEDDISLKNWDSLTDEDFEGFVSCGYRLIEHDREYMEHSSAFTARVLAHLCENEQDLRERLLTLFSDSSYGRILRVKGHIRDVGGSWYEVNCTADSFHIRPANVKKGLFIVIGQELSEDRLQQAFIPRQR